MLGEALNTIKTPEWKQVLWQPRVAGGKRDVPIRYLTNHDAPEMLVFPGIGEEYKAAWAYMDIMNDAGIPAAVVILAFHHLPSTEANIELIVVEGPQAVAKAINLQANRKEDAKVKLVGVSQGGGVVAVTAHEAPELYSDIGMRSPGSLNNKFLGETIDERRKELLWRLAVTNMGHDDQKFYREGNFKAFREVKGRITRDWWGQRRERPSTPATPIYDRLKTKINYAVRENRAEMFRDVLLSHRSRLFVGAEDPIFPPDEMILSLMEVGLTVDEVAEKVEVIPGSHPSIHSARGKEQLTRIVGWMNEQQSAA